VLWPQRNASPLVLRHRHGGEHPEGAVEPQPPRRARQLRREGVLVLQGGHGHGEGLRGGRGPGGGVGRLEAEGEAEAGGGGARGGVGVGSPATAPPRRAP